MINLQYAARRFLRLCRASILLASSSCCPSKRWKGNTWNMSSPLRASKPDWLLFAWPALLMSSSWSMNTWSRMKLSSSVCKEESGVKTRGSRCSRPEDIIWWLKINSRSHSMVKACNECELWIEWFKLYVEIKEYCCHCDHTCSFTAVFMLVR